MYHPNDFRAVLEKLAQPFPAEVIEWRPGQVKGNRAQALPYVDSRVYMDRLDEAAPGWLDDYSLHITDGKLIVVCELEVAGVRRCDLGEARLDDENAATKAAAQAFKRACAKFGLGRGLYEWPRIWADYDPQRKTFTPEAWKLLRSKAVEFTRGKAATTASSVETKPDHSETQQPPRPSRAPQPDYTAFWREVRKRGLTAEQVKKELGATPKEWLAAHPGSTLDDALAIVLASQESQAGAEAEAATPLDALEQSQTGQGASPEASRPDLLATVKRPTDPQTLKRCLQGLAMFYLRPGKNGGRGLKGPATPKQIGLVAGLLNGALKEWDDPDEARHQVLQHLVDKPSAKALTKYEAAALLDWLTGGEGSELDSLAATEARAVAKAVAGSEKEAEEPTGGDGDGDPFANAESFRERSFGGPSGTSGRSCKPRGVPSGPWKNTLSTMGR